MSRFSTVPFDEQTELMEAVLWAKGRGLIAGESGLLLWDLADVSPRQIHIAVPPGWRTRLTVQRALGGCGQSTAVPAA